MNRARSRTNNRVVFVARIDAEAFWLRTTDPGARSRTARTGRAVTRAIAAQAARDELRTLAIDGTVSVQDVAQTLAERFGLLG